MPVPKRRHGRARQGKLRAHKKLHPSLLVPCEECGSPKLRHRICSSCGTYKQVQYKETTTS